MFEILMWPFRMVFGLIGWIFEMVFGLIGGVFGLVGGILGFIFSAGAFFLVVFGLVVLIRWIVQGARRT